MDDKRIEICDNDGDNKARPEKRSISEWDDNTLAPSEVIGFEPGNSKLKVLQLFVGYSQEQIVSPSFQNQIQIDKKIFLDQLGSRYFDVGHVNKPMKIGLNQQERTVTPSLNPLKLLDIVKLESEIRKAHPNVDVIAIRVNPDLVDYSQIAGAKRFGAASIGLDTFVSPGPATGQNSKYGELFTSSIMAHEFSHVLSGFTKGMGLLPMGGVYIGDSYSYDSTSYRTLASGRHSELTLAPNLEGIDKYYPSGVSKPLADALKTVKPKFEDTGYQCTEKSWFGKDKVHPVYTMNSGPDLMEQNFTNDQLLSGMKVVTPLQKALFHGIASDYLKKEKRLDTNSNAYDGAVQANVIPNLGKPKGHSAPN